MMAGTSLRYFTGIDWFESERFMVMALPAKSAPFYVSPAFEEGRCREQITNGLGDNSPDVRVWQEDQDPYPLLAQGLKDRGLATGTIGLEETFRYVFSAGGGKSRGTGQADQRHSSHRGMPHDQELLRTGAHAPGIAGDSFCLRGGLSLNQRRHDQAGIRRFDRAGPYETRFPWGRRRVGRRIRGISPRFGHAAGNPRRQRAPSYSANQPRR